MHRENLFPHLWRHVCELEEQRLATWAALTTPEAIRARQAYVRQTVQAMIGPFPERCALNPRVVRTLDRPDYTVELVLFDSRPDFPVTATVYLPKRGDGPFPAVVSPCGHSANGRLYEVYQRAHIALAKQGYAVISYDPISQGERVQYLNADGQGSINNCCHEHCMAGNQIELVRGSMANLRIWDGIRAMDYLVSRPEVDAARVGVAGNSGGGTLSAWLLCLDERYAAGSPNCFITTLVHRIATRMTADSEQQFTPMLKAGIDHQDMLLPAAPKPVLISAALRDFFPIDGARRTTADLRRIYEVLGAPDCVDIHTSDDTHGWTKPLREGVVRWFNQHLRGVDEPYDEPDFPVDDEATLYATATGQVLSSGLGAVGVHEIVKRYYPVNLACRQAADPVAATRAKLPELLAVDPAAAARPWPRPDRREAPVVLPPAPKGAQVERVSFLSDFDVEVGGLLFTPTGGQGPGVVLVPDDGGMMTQLDRGSLAWQLALAGETVLVIDPRGIGTALGAAPTWCSAPYYHAFYGIEVDLTYTSWMIGRPLVGQRTFDVLCAVNWLRRRGLTVRLTGLGHGGVLALLAGALDPEVTAVDVDGALLSWQTLYESETYDYLPNLMLPGALSACDLPDVAATIAPRPLAVRNPLDAHRRPVAAEALAEAYAPALAAYRAAGVADRLQLTTERGEPAREPAPAD